VAPQLRIWPFGSGRLLATTSPAWLWDPTPPSHLHPWWGGGGSGRDLWHGTIHPNHLGRPLLLASMRPFWTPPPPPQGGVLMAFRLALSLEEIVVVQPFPPHGGQILHALAQHPATERQAGRFGMVADGSCGHCGGLKTCSTSFSTAQWWPTPGMASTSGWWARCLGCPLTMSFSCWPTGQSRWQ
jgi:hypothetical protein